MKNFIFLVGTMNNLELGGPRTSWIDEILLPHLCIACFITFLAIYQGKFGFGKFSTKTWASVRPSPALFSENAFWGPPLASLLDSSHIDISTCEYASFPLAESSVSVHLSFGSFGMAHQDWRFISILRGTRSGRYNPWASYKRWLALPRYGVK